MVPTPGGTMSGLTRPEMVAVSWTGWVSVTGPKAWVTIAGWAGTTTLLSSGSAQRVARGVLLTSPL